MNCNQQVNSTFPVQPLQPMEQGVGTKTLLNKIGLRRDGRYEEVSVSRGPGCQKGWVTENPLSFDAVRAVRTVFNKPPYTGNVNVGDVCHDEIYSDQFSGIGGVYENYSSIQGGQIQYYIDSTTMNPYYTPNFITPALVQGVDFVDPNLAVKPQYERFPAQNYSWNRDYDECDSFTHDTLEFRQDIMSKQMRKQNQQSYVNRWGFQIL